MGSASWCALQPYHLMLLVNIYFNFKHCLWPQAVLDMQLPDYKASSKSHSVVFTDVETKVSAAVQLLQEALVDERHGAAPSAAELPERIRQKKRQIQASTRSSSHCSGVVLDFSLSNRYVSVCIFALMAGCRPI